MGKLFVLGFGPGDAKNMTEACRDCLNSADIIVGYSGYLELLRPLFPNQNYYETGMTKERARCQTAIDFAKSGKTVAVVSSGDSGVYGMASLIIELAGDKPEIVIEIIPGVTAATSGAALLGAPLSHDFAVVSLSDLLTPWSVIERRLRAAAAGDFAICLYNPGSKKRAGHLRRASDILLENMPLDRPCGIVRNIAREGESMTLLTLGELRNLEAEMTETVFIGNSTTTVIAGRMVTPRGYLND